VRASPQVWTQFSTTREIGLNKHDSQKSAELNNPERGTVEQGSQVEQSVAPVKIIEARSVREADIHVLEEIGRGSHGCCYKARCRKTKQLYCMKKVNMAKFSEEKRTLAYHEVDLLRQLSHPNIVSYVDSYENSNQELCIVMEYADHKDCDALIAARQKAVTSATDGGFGEALVWRFVWQLSCAVRHLHSIGIMHRDIKASNVLLSGLRRSLKVVDLGVACRVQHPEELHTSPVGTPMYMAPELVEQEPYDCKADVWSTACLLYCICALRMPFEANNTLQLHHAIVHKEPAPIPDQYSLELHNLLRLMLMKDRMDRVSSHGVLDLIPAALRRHFSCSEHEPPHTMVLTALTFSPRSPPLLAMGSRPHTVEGRRRTRGCGGDIPPLPGRGIENAFIPVRIEVKQHGHNKSLERLSNKPEMPTGSLRRKL